MLRKLILLFAFAISFLATPTYALYQPSIEENARMETYQAKVKTYSPQNQQKLENLSKSIVDLNKKQTDELTQLMERQGEILDELTTRQGKLEGVGTDGITRNLKDPIENARYWLTYAHEAVAFQAAKNYIFTLSSETNIKRDATNTVSQYKNDINILRTKVEKSRKIIEQLLAE